LIHGVDRQWLSPHAADERERRTKRERDRASLAVSPPSLAPLKKQGSPPRPRRRSVDGDERGASYEDDERDADGGGYGGGGGVAGLQRKLEYLRAVDSLSFLGRAQLARMAGVMRRSLHDAETEVRGLMASVAAHPSLPRCISLSPPRGRRSSSPLKNEEVPTTACT
jgi:hypothetical protein